MTWFQRKAPDLLGYNLFSTPKDVIVDQMNEPRPLPMGKAEFDTWADRIIGGALVSADRDSQRWALANMIMHLGPTESHKPDAYFIHSLRKAAVNQVADAIRQEYNAAAQAKKKAEAEAASHA